jgi:hypothetical protein
VWGPKTRGSYESGSGSKCGSRSGTLVHLHHSIKIKSHKKSQKQSQQGFSYIFIFVFVLMTKGSGCGASHTVKKAVELLEVPLGNPFPMMDWYVSSL